MSKFILKTFEAEKHFAEVSTWWKFWRWTEHPTPVILSDIGFIVEAEGVNICAGWLYLTNSIIGSMEFLVSNPFVDRKLRSEALDFLINSINHRSEQEGKIVFMTNINNEALAKRLLTLGFIAGDKGNQQFIRAKK
jgi:hypothetical protein